MGELHPLVWLPLEVSVYWRPGLAGQDQAKVGVPACRWQEGRHRGSPGTVGNCGGRLCSAQSWVPEAGTWAATSLESLSMAASAWGGCGLRGEPVTGTVHVDMPGFQPWLL